MSDRELKSLGIAIPPKVSKEKIEESKSHSQLTNKFGPYNDGLAFVEIKEDMIDQGKEWLSIHGFSTIMELGKGYLGVAGSPQYLAKLIAENPDWAKQIIPNKPIFKLVH